MPKLPRGLFRRGQSYYIRIKRGGKDTARSLGPDRAEALVRYRRLRRELEFGDMPRARWTVANAAEKWLETYVGTTRNEKGQRLARRRVEMYLKPRLGYKSMHRVTRDDLRDYRRWLESHRISSRTVAHILSDARCFFNWAEDAGHIDRAPVPKRLLPRIQESPPDRLTDAEVDLLLTELDGPLAWTIWFGLVSGMRWGEMCRAQVSDVDFCTGEIVVHHTKTWKLRRVRLHDEFLAELRGRVGKIVPYSVGSSSSIRRDVRKRTGIEDFRLKRLRATYACRFIENGGGILVLSMNLGHASVTTTERKYARLSAEVVRRETERVHSKSVTKSVTAKESNAVTPYALVAQVDRATVS